MKNPLLLSALLVFSAVPAWAQHDDGGTPLTSEAELNALCQDMAKEDKVSAADMQEYMQDCMEAIEEEMPSGDQEETGKN